MSKDSEELNSAEKFQEKIRKEVQTLIDQCNGDPLEVITTLIDKYSDPIRSHLWKYYLRKMHQDLSKAENDNTEAQMILQILQGLYVSYLNITERIDVPVLDRPISDVFKDMLGNNFWYNIDYLKQRKSN